MDAMQQEAVRSVLSTLQGQRALIEDALEKKDVRRIANDLQHLKYVVSRSLEMITDTEDAELMAHGPSVRRSRINGPWFRERILEVMQDFPDGIGPKELVAELERRGINVPGQRDSANVITHLGTLIEQQYVSRAGYGCYKLTAKGKRFKVKQTA